VGGAASRGRPARVERAAAAQAGAEQHGSEDVDADEGAEHVVRRWGVARYLEKW
jgi:hypothetical protein